MRAEAIFGLGVLAIILASVIGYVTNIYKFAAYSDFKAPYASEVVRVAGVAIPIVGAVVGYITFEDEEK